MKSIALFAKVSLKDSKTMQVQVLVLVLKLKLKDSEVPNGLVSVVHVHLCMMNIPYVQVVHHVLHPSSCTHTK
jgi:hypothetical protein